MCFMLWNISEANVTHSFTVRTIHKGTSIQLDTHPATQPSIHPPHTHVCILPPASRSVSQSPPPLFLPVCTDDSTRCAHHIT